VRRGFYLRRLDGRFLQRYKCTLCRRSFSSEYYKCTYREKRPDLRAPIFKYLVSTASLRRTAILVGTTRTTVKRKFIRMGRLALALIAIDNLKAPKAQEFEFDDMETSCHTKYKPYSITLAVETKTRRILGFRVSQMPTKGSYSAIALRKYGPRKDLRSEGRRRLFEDLIPIVSPTSLMKSDQNPHYVKDVKEYFPEAQYQRFKGRKPRSDGQGELKKGPFDPLYSLNHTCAMFRANVNRLIRETWCLSKMPERLTYHLALYAIYHNRYVISHPSR
jgi:hypothetical protein